MTTTITRAAQGVFDPATRDEASRFTKFAYCIAGTRAQKQTALAEIFTRPDFVFEATTSTNDAVTLANLGVNLTSKGVTFPAGTIRKIRVKARSRAGSGAQTVTGFVETTFHVLGGTDPSMRVQTTGTGQNVSPPTTTSIPTGVSTTFQPVAGTTTTPIYAHAIVAASTTPTPDQIYVGVLGSNGTGAGNINWRVEVFVEPLETIALGATG